MCKKNIYFVQPSNRVSNAIYLPYATGCLAAYAFSFESIKENYKLCEFIYEKKPLEENLEIFDNPFFVGFSSYLWNVEYNFALAKLVKEKFPQAIIAFGGPQIPDSKEYLEKYEFIDILMHGEGEQTFYSLLTALQNGNDLSEVYSIYYRDGDKIIYNPKGAPTDIYNYPSPYSMGMFDYIVNDPKNADIQFDVVVETNRGCPFSCAFCAWSDTGESFRKFSMDRVKGDFDWISAHKLPYCFIVDGNFGILDRDMDILDYVIELKKKNGYPQALETTMTKKKNGKVFLMSKKMEEYGLNKGVSFAVQSFDPEVQKISNRISPSYEQYRDWVNMYTDNGITVYTDLILGLPGQTYKSFCNDIFKILEIEKPIYIQIFRCQLLPNTPLGSQEFIEKYKIRTVETNMGQSHIKPIHNKIFGTRSNTVVETDVLPVDDWKKSIIMSCYVQTFYSLGLLKNMISYVVHDCGVTYGDFFNEFFDFVETRSPYLKNMMVKYFSFIDKFLDGSGTIGFTEERFGDIVWPMDQGLFLIIISNIEPFFDEIRKFLGTFIKDEKIASELVEYQKMSILTPGKTSQTAVFNHNWREYFMGEKFAECENNYKFVAENITDDWEQFAKYYLWWHHRQLKAISPVERV